MAFISDLRTRELTETEIRSTTLLAILQEQQVVLVSGTLFPCIYDAEICVGSENKVFQFVSLNLQSIFSNLCV